MRMYATPQNMNPKKESKRELSKESKSEKNGMISATIKASTQVNAKIPAQESHPTIVWLPLWRVPSNSRKNTNLADTEAYKTPRKIRVGIINENETFLKTSFPREPKAGAVLYCVPVYAKCAVSNPCSTEITSAKCWAKALKKRWKGAIVD